MDGEDNELKREDPAMADVPMQLVVAAFDDESAAGEALKALKQAKKERLIGIEAAAVLRKDDKGKLHIKETTDMGGGKGAAIGGALGAGIGAIAGAALAAPLVVGALIGGLAAKASDSGFENDRLKQLGDSLTPGSSAIVALVEHTWVDEVRNAMAQEASDLVTAELSANIAEQLETHHDVAYTALKTDGSLTVGELAVGDDDAEGGIMTIAGEELTASSFVATDEGIVVGAADVGPDGVVAGIAAEMTDDADSDGEGDA
jgi:uncharacterized membrane protein